MKRRLGKYPKKSMLYDRRKELKLDDVLKVGSKGTMIIPQNEWPKVKEYFNTLTHE